VVDLGGEQGVLLSALCERYGFKGTVVDREGKKWVRFGVSCGILRYPGIPQSWWLIVI
jgi:hypothetical protein